ncbi:hypothetical protein AAFC00_000875 [Neodothiora populina]|uniref:DUF159 domain protein n=1 Tax=Neodothiora populina TaxID=2781224 RepID=A0ABR3PM56_9PEZI
MCGRYAMSFRPSMARRRLQDEHMQVDDAPDDEDETLRQSYNFAPGYHGLVYRAEVPDTGAGSQDTESATDNASSTSTTAEKEQHAQKQGVDGATTKDTKYKLQAMKWGLIPFWTKRAPDYGSQLKTINCRDDSLAQAGGMWNTMKQKKRCIIIAEGFYEWLKKNNGREKIPHFVKRKDGQLMCFAGLWDCVKYEGHDEKLYTYTIITTSSNKQLNFLHDRMPVILENGSEEMKLWLDPSRSSWSKELQSLLQPYRGELECYAVDKAVGKVGNNSPNFIVPISSKENKNNIANFFSKQKEEARGQAETEIVKKEEEDDDDDDDDDDVKSRAKEIKREPGENRYTDVDPVSTEDNAPLPKPKDELSDENPKEGIKRENPDAHDLTDIKSPYLKKARSSIADDGYTEEPHLKSPGEDLAPTRKTRSATSNGSAAKAASKSRADGTQKITSFFGK